MSDELATGYHTIVHSLDTSNAVEIVVTDAAEVKALSETTMKGYYPYPSTVWSAAVQPNNPGFYSLLNFKTKKYLNHNGKEFVLLNEAYYWKIDTDDGGKHYRIHKDKNSAIERPATEGNLVLTNQHSKSGNGQWTFKHAEAGDEA